MILTLLLLACRCGGDTPERPSVPEIDRDAVQGATCYRGEDGTVLELVVSASADATGVLTLPDAAPVALEGRRAGRVLRFDGVTVELLGRTVSLQRDGEQVLLQNGPCQ